MREYLSESIYLICDDLCERFGFLLQLHLHTSNMDFEKFYTEHIPKSSLPSDYGGDLESIAELHDKHCTELKILRNFFLAEEQQAALKLDVICKNNLQTELINESERGIRSLTLGDH